MHAYVHTLFETQQNDTLADLRTAIPPLFKLDNILRQCSDIEKIKAACAKESDFETAITYARLSSFQALKLLWFTVIQCTRQTQPIVKKREESEHEGEGENQVEVAEN